MEPSLAADVRAAANRVVAAGTAHGSLRTDIDFAAYSRLAGFFSGLMDESEPKPTPVARGVMSVVGRTVGAVEGWLSRAASGKGDCSIDFTAGSCLIRRDTKEQYLEPGLRLDLVSDHSWRVRVPSRPIPGVHRLTPVWLVAVAGGMVDATVVGEEMIDEAACRHLTGTCDVQAAAARSGHELDFKGLGEAGESAIAVEVWIDPGGMLRRVASRISDEISEPDDEVLRRMASNVSTYSAELTLSRFGKEPAPVKPAPEQIDPGEDQFPKVAERVLAAWTERVAEVLPLGVRVIVRDRGYILEIDPPAGHGGGAQFMWATALAVPATHKMKLERAFGALARHTEDVLSAGLKRGPWPGPEPETHVTVSSEDVQVWWSSPGRPASGRTRPIPEITIRLRPIPRAEIGL